MGPEEACIDGSDHDAEGTNEGDGTTMLEAHYGTDYSCLEEGPGRRASFGHSGRHRRHRSCRRRRRAAALHVGIRRTGRTAP